MLIIAIFMGALYLILGFFEHEWLRHIFKLKLDQVRNSGVASPVDIENIAVASSLLFVVLAPFLIYVSFHERIPYGTAEYSFVKQPLIARAVIGLFFLMAVSLSVVVFPYSASLPVDFFFQTSFRYFFANVLLIWVFGYVLLLEVSLVKDLAQKIKGRMMK
ncbi:hypothetical protein [Phytopseudomonas flavescens]|uniref:hypothetical protein n=1 Tax=Phytopseudomonas flavescens TaxID=29435 RepID=UPI0009FC35AC|nr:hypothetical protein [Pseudomonas flavescens]